MKKTTFFLCLALAAACGGDEESNTENPTTPTGETPTTEPAPPPIEPQVCAAERHTCMMKASGEVYCAGRNLDGELGDSTAQTRWNWVPVSGLTDAKALACGYRHTCALRRDGSVSCWGVNDHGELGAGNNDVTHVPVAVSGLSGVEEISAGHSFTCARIGGAVKCWGRGNEGQLGNAGTDDQTSPVDVQALTDAASISAGRAHVCARRTGGQVSCWGANSQGQLGQGGDNTRRSNTPVEVAGLTGATQVAAGGNHSCAATAANVQCWGQNDSGQLGNGTAESGAKSTSPVPVQTLTQVAQLGLATRRSCALLASGEAHCWGYNNYTAKLLAVGSEEGNVPTPTQVQGLANAARFDTHANHACAVTRDAKLVCWGAAGDGRMGNGDNHSLHEASDVVANIAALTAEAQSPATFPAAEGENTYSLHFAVGSHSVCGITDGRVVCFGSGDDGRLGHGSTRANPASGATPVAGITDAVQVDTGLGRSCALRRSGQVACWGNLGGQLHTSLPVPIEGITDAKFLAVGGTAYAMTACVIHREDGGVSCWGNNGSGELGRGQRSNEAQMTPARIPEFTGAEEIVVGTSSVCARNGEGKVFCWGSGSYGQIGNGGTDSSPSPVQVSGITDATDIGGGGYNGYALRRNGSVMAWGSNEDGQIGNGQSGRDNNVSAPVAVRGLRNVASLGKMGDSVCAPLRDGTMRCWGANDFGQTGHEEAETDDVTSPWEWKHDHDEGVAAFGDIVHAGCGWNFCCALHAQGQVSCAGSTPIGGSGGFLGMSNRRSTTPIAATGIQFTVPQEGEGEAAE